MDKLTRTVTIMIAIVIAVSAVLLAFFLTRSNEQKAESSSSVDTDEKATLVSPSIEHVQSMTITNQYGTYTIVPFGDPSVFPGTGTPEAGGVSFQELLEAMIQVSHLNIVGFDVNELSPVYDQSGSSTAMACKVLRELLIAVMKNRAE